jgi:hypothetical protein
MALLNRTYLTPDSFKGIGNKLERQRPNLSSYSNQKSPSFQFDTTAIVQPWTCLELVNRIFFSQTSVERVRDDIPSRSASAMDCDAIFSQCSGFFKLERVG